MEQYELDAVKRITTRPARDHRTLAMLDGAIVEQLPS